MPARCVRLVLKSWWSGLGGHLQEIFAGTTTAIGVKLLTALMQLALSFVLARTLGAQGAGVFFLAFTVSWVVAVVARGGMDNAVLREVATTFSRRQWSRMKGATRAGVAVVLASSVLCSCSVLACAPWIANQLFHDPNLLSPLRVAGLAAAPLAVSLFAGEMLRGLRKILASQLIEGTFVPGLTALGVMMLSPTYGSIGAVWAFAGAAAVTAAMSLVLWSRATSMLREVRPDYRVSMVFKRARALFWYALMFMTVNWAAFVFLGIYGRSEDVGVFGVAWRASMMLSFPLLAAESIAAPKFAALHDRGSRVELESVCRSISLGLLAVGTPILVAVVLWNQQIMGIFGQDFATGGPILVILALGRIVTLGMGPVTTLLIMASQERAARNLITLVAIYVLLGNVLLVPRLGALGSAVIQATALAMNHAAAAVIVRQRLGFWPIPIGSIVLRQTSARCGADPDSQR